MRLWVIEKKLATCFTASLSERAKTFLGLLFLLLLLLSRLDLFLLLFCLWMKRKIWILLRDMKTKSRDQMLHYCCYSNIQNLYSRVTSTEILHLFCVVKLFLDSQKTLILVKSSLCHFIVKRVKCKVELKLECSKIIKEFFSDSLFSYFIHKNKICVGTLSRWERFRNKMKSQRTCRAILKR